MITIIKHFKAKAVLLNPFWPSHPWWPLLSSNGLAFHSFIRDCLVLPQLPDLFAPALALSTGKKLCCCGSL